MSALQSAAELWAELETVGKIQPTYDDGFVADVREQLKLPGGEIGPALESANVTIEKLLAAVLHALAPFSGMLNDLYAMLAEQDAKTRDSTIPLRYSFGQDDEEFAFDLEHFRQAERVLGEAAALQPVVSTRDLWDMSSLVWRSVVQGKPEPNLPERVSSWTETATRRDADPRWVLPVPRPPSTSIARVDALVDRVYRVIADIATRCAAYGSTDVLSAADGSGDREARTPLRDWPAEALSEMENDYFTANMLRAVWQWALALSAEKLEHRAAAAEPFASELETLLDSWPHAPVPTWHEDLLAVLELPMWQKRDALYEAWMLTVIRQALRRHSFRLVVDAGGAISFRERETTLARAESEDGPLEVRGELKTRLDVKPVTRDRKEFIQPDYAIVAGDPSSTRVIVEVKQYARSLVVGWANILTDYARGHPTAHVVLVAYNPVSVRLVEEVYEDVRARCAAFGSVHPGQAGALASVVGDIESALPGPPVPPAPTGPAPAGAMISVIAVDVSGSMAQLLDSVHVRADLERLELSYPDARWIGVDVVVRSDEGLDGTLRAVLALRRDQTTDLPRALALTDPGGLIVVTDDEGAAPLRATGLAALGVVSSTGVAWVT